MGKKQLGNPRNKLESKTRIKVTGFGAECVE
jgi:hypothetical protein